ncbi:HNH endonuclease [Halosimplex halophilum]|uniref:HNH endonuclease n=1 Tax=Halosimplex halophilum TaxID=2559572 RepID=UPI00107FC592|nr:HNH endonuclease [Halosimplex halophilum]
MPTPFTRTKYTDWFNYDIRVEPEENHYVAHIEAEPSSRKDDIDTVTTDEWNLTIGSIPSFVGLEQNNPQKRSATFTIADSDTDATRGTIKAELVQETDTDFNTDRNSVPVQVTVPAAGPLTIAHRLLDEAPDSEPSYDLIEAIHDTYDEDKPYNELNEFRSDIAQVSDIFSYLDLVNKLCLHSEQLKQSLSNSIERFLAKSLLGRPEKERCLKDSDTYDDVLERFHSETYPGLPSINTDLIQSEYLRRYCTADDPQTTPTDYGFDKTPSAILYTDWGAYKLAQGVVEHGPKRVQEALLDLISDEGQSLIGQGDGEADIKEWYEKQKEQALNGDLSLSERANLLAEIIRYAATLDTHEFEYILSNYCYRKGINADDPTWAQTLFEATALLCDSDHLDIPVYHRKAKIFYNQQKALQFRFDHDIDDTIGQQERYESAEEHYRSACRLARTETNEFSPQPSLAAQTRQSAAAMAVRRFTAQNEFDQALDELNEALDTLDEILDDDAPDYEQISTRLEAEQKAILGHKYREQGNFRQAIERFWEARRLYADSSKHHSKARMAEYIESTFRQLEEDGRGTAQAEAVKTAVRDAYDERCAVCGSRRHSPTGDPEVEVAHIKAKSDDGLYVRENLLPLCQFHHWAFDNDWFYVGNDYTIQVTDVTTVPGYDDLSDIDGQPLKEPDVDDFPQPHQMFLTANRQANQFAPDEPPDEISPPDISSETDALSHGAERYQWKDKLDTGIQGTQNELIASPETLL